MSEDFSKSNFDLEAAVENLHHKLETVLKRLETKNGPKVTHQHMGLLSLGNDLAFKDKKESTRTKMALESAIKALSKAEEALNRLPEKVNRRLNRFSDLSSDNRISEDWGDADDLPAERPHLDAILAIKNELRVDLKLTKIERFLVWNGRGASFDAQARYVAWKVAEIYMELRKGEVPTMSKNDSDEPTSPYTRAVNSVFHLLSIKVSYRSPCEHVIKVLKNGGDIPNHTDWLNIANNPDLYPGIIDGI